MAGQALQRIDIGDLASVLAQINNNFAIIQNSPFFRGIPGAQGIQGNTGNTGVRGSKIFVAAFTAFKAKFTELNNQMISALDATFINTKLGTNFQDVCDALGVPSSDTLLTGDVILLESDLGLYTYNSTSNNITDTGVHLVSDNTILANIDTLVKNSVQEYIASLSQQTICLKECKTIATNDCLSGVAPNAITSKTSYFPYLADALVPSSLDVTTKDPQVTIATQYRHKHFSLDNDLTKFNSTTPYKVSVVMGALAEYIKMLKNGTDQNLAGNIVNPTYDKMPAMILMQNDYNSGLVIGHRASTTMDEYGILYKNAAGQLCLRREHRWITPGTSSQPVTELQVGAGEYDFKEGHIILDNLYYMKSDFLDSLTSPMVVRIGFGNNQGSKLQLDALTYNFTNGVAGKVLELDHNKNLRTGDQTVSNVNYRLHQIVDNDDLVSGTDAAKSALRKTWFDQHYRPESTTYNENTLKHNVCNEYTVAQMYDSIQDQLDNVWFKDEYYVKLTEDQYMKKFTDKIPSLKLSENLHLGRNYETIASNNVKTDHYLIPFEVEKLATPINYGVLGQATDVVRIGIHRSITHHGLGDSIQDEQSKTTIELNWLKLYVKALEPRSVFVVNDDNEISLESDYQLARGENNFATNCNVNPESLNYTGTSKVLLESKVTGGAYCIDDNGDNNDSIEHEKRFLNGYHLLGVFKFLDRLVNWIKDTFMRKSDYEDDLVPVGTVTAYSPMINYSGNVTGTWKFPLDLTTTTTNVNIPTGWVPCVEGELLEVTKTAAISRPYNVDAVYRIPDLRDRFIIGYPTRDNGTFIDVDIAGKYSVTTQEKGSQQASHIPKRMYYEQTFDTGSESLSIKSAQMMYIMKAPKISGATKALYMSVGTKTTLAPTITTKIVYHKICGDFTLPSIIYDTDISHS